MAVQITRRRMRSGGAGSPAFSALALTGGFAGTAAVPVGLAVELGVSAVFVSAWSAIGNYVNLMLGKQYKCNQTFFYKPRVVRCQADLEDGRAYSHRIPLANLKCLSEKRQWELAARLGGEPGGARVNSAHGRHSLFRPGA